MQLESTVDDIFHFPPIFDSSFLYSFAHFSVRPECLHMFFDISVNIESIS